jgi:predicted RND superfamily exporter protein
MNILERLVKKTTRHPVKTVAIVLGITMLAAILALKLTIDTSLEEFYESDGPDFLAAEAVEERFGGSNTVVVIDCSDSNAYTARAYARALAKKLEKDSRWDDVQYKKDLSFAAEKGILYLPEEQFAALTDPHTAPGMLGALPTSALEKATLSEYIVSDNKQIYLITIGFTIDEENPMERNYLLDDLGRLITETKGG